MWKGNFFNRDERPLIKICARTQEYRKILAFHLTRVFWRFTHNSNILDLCFLCSRLRSLLNFSFLWFMRTRGIIIIDFMLDWEEMGEISHSTLHQNSKYSIHLSRRWLLKSQNENAYVVRNDCEIRGAFIKVIKYVN